MGDTIEEFLFELAQKLERLGVSKHRSTEKYGFIDEKNSF